jgi:putative addiction module CopG family antidote
LKESAVAKPLDLNDLPADLARFAEAQMSAGRFASVEEVLRAGKDALERQQHDDEKMSTLRAAIAEGDASPDAPPGVFARVRAKHGLPAAR